MKTNPERTSNRDGRGAARNRRLRGLAVATLTTLGAGLLVAGASGCGDDDESGGPVAACDPAALQPDVIGELEPVAGHLGAGFTRVFYPSRLDETPIDGTFAFWSEPVTVLYKLVVGDTPSFEPVTGAAVAGVGFTGASMDGKYYICENQDLSGCRLLEIDPETNVGTPRATVPGLVYGLGRLAGGDVSAGDDLFYITVVTFGTQGERTTYVTTLDSLDGTVSLDDAIEIAGNGVTEVFGGSVYVGAAESPTITRYTPDAEGHLQPNGVVNFSAQGLTRYPFGSAIADGTRAFAVDDETFQIVVWNPTAMTYTSSIFLNQIPGVVRSDIPAEFWTTAVHDGRLYIPVRYVDWTPGAERVPSIVKLVIIDAATLAVLGVAEDDRCANGGQPTFDEDGNAYVLADGRNWSAQLYACLAGEPVPSSCLLRINAGEVDFDADYFVDVPSIIPAD